MLQRVMLDGIKLPRLYIAENASDVELARSNGIPYVKWRHGQEQLIKMLLRPTLERMFPHIAWNKVLGQRKRFRTEVEICEQVPNDGQDQVEEVGRIDESDAGMLDESLAWKPSEVVDNGVEAEGMATVDPDGTIVETAVIADGERLFHTEHSLAVYTKKLSIQDYVGDMSSYVDLDVLQRLRLMPAFIGDILDCVRINIGSGMRWSEGYNKRRDLPVGRYNSSTQLPNLIILDVSGSIPRGISATMISLVDTLRTQLSADLIITSTISRFYPMGATLPDPDSIRGQFGYGNESCDFFGILTNNVRGRHYGHVFSFGDDDTPVYRVFRDNPNEYNLANTVVEHVHHYHTGRYIPRGSTKRKTGYAKWCHMLGKKPIEDYDTSWCKVIGD